MIHMYVIEMLKLDTEWKKKIFAFDNTQYYTEQLAM